MAKMIVYGEEARKSLQKGIDQLANMEAPQSRASFRYFSAASFALS